VENVPLIIAGLLGSAFLVGCLVEFLLWLFERPSSSDGEERTTRTDRRPDE
jgi:hypothetical protein